MNSCGFASKFCQVSWVVKDIKATERFFIDVIGVEKFFRMENVKAVDTEGTYMGRPGDWVFHLYLAYAGDTQIELIQPISGQSMYTNALERHGDCVQHVAYWLDESEHEAACIRLESSGFPMIQSLMLPTAKVSYFDTRAAIGVVTEVVGSNQQGYEFIENLKHGRF